MNIPDQHPVIIGVGQLTWREPDTGRTPTDALEAVCRIALEDCGRDVRKAVDALATVRFVADTDAGAGAVFPRDPGAEVSARLGLDNPARFIGTIGGNTPQYLVNRFVERLQREEHRVVLLAGTELMATFFDALRSGGDLGSWSDGGAEPPTVGADRDGLSDTEKAHGLYQPINTYPLFENSLRHHLGHDLAEHLQSISEISSRMTAVAAENPHAWRQKFRTAEDIGTVAVSNRYIGFPYTRAMNALMEVDMAAAVVLTTAGTARELGVDRERWVFPRGGVDVNDIWFPSERADLHSSPAIRLGWQALSRHAGITLDKVGRFDIYSCFPSAVQVSCAEIGLSPLDERGVTVTGGLPYFGGPGNNYSLHAIAQMVDTLRREGGNGLVTANGLYLTKHSLGLYSSEAAGEVRDLPDSGALQREVDRGPRVAVATDPAGDATVETYTVAFGREGPERGILVARNDSGERLLALAPDNGDALDALLSEDPIGRRGRVSCTDGVNTLEL